MAGDPGPDLDLVPFDPRGVVVLVGPTSSGKTALSLQLAEALPVEVVCMDAMQLYREMKVGTARPTVYAARGIPDHLFGSISVRTPMNAQRYAAATSRIVADIQGRGRIPLLVGGTGLYMKALFEGLDTLPATPPPLRARLEAMAEAGGPSRLYRLLERLDPEGAARLHSNDRQRIMRFLEVRFITKRGILSLWRESKKSMPTPPLTIGLEVARNLLDERIAAAVKSMLEGGWQEETRALSTAGLLEAVVSLGAIGYADVADLIAGARPESEVFERIFRATRRYAKRQMTWFRKTSQIRWFPFTPDSGYNTAGIIEAVQGNMG